MTSILAAVTSEVICAEPSIRLLPGLLSEQECEAVIQAAQMMMRQATVYRGGELVQLGEYREAEVGFLAATLPACGPMVKALLACAGGEIGQVERVQVTHYLVGGRYKVHHDGLWPLDARQQAAGGQRTWSLLAYLHAPAEGGETTFPEAGIAVNPIAGNAVVWPNLLPDGGLDRRVLHAAEPVRSGEKWVAVVWLRERHRKGAECSR